MEWVGFWCFVRFGEKGAAGARWNAPGKISTRVFRWLCPFTSIVVWGYAVRGQE